jgi:hypothetical protein
MTRLLGNSLPLPYLRRAELINGAPAKAEIPRVLGGNTRFLREWVTGEGSTFDGTDVDPPCAPVTGNCPHESNGLRVTPGPGHDHSGGVMGVPIVRNVWMAIYGDLENGQTGGRAMKTTLTSTNSNVEIVATSVPALWIPWSMSDGAYSTLTWRGFMHVDVVCDYRIEVRSGIDTVVKSGTFGGTGYQRLTLDREIACRPGRFNPAYCKINVTRIDPNDAVVHCISWGLFQVKTTP